MPSRDAGEDPLPQESFRLGLAAARARYRGLQRPRSPPLGLTPSWPPLPPARHAAVVEASPLPPPARDGHCRHRARSGACRAGRRADRSPRLRASG